VLTTLLAAAVVLGVVILVHELGHFWVAKWADVEVPRFSIGIGPKMVGFRWGETEYVLSWLPLGGYVRMAGMGEEEAFEGIEGEAPEEDRQPSDRDFDAKPVWMRGAILSAGVGMNFLFAAVLFGIIGSVWGVAPEQEPVIGGVQEEALPPEALPLARLDRGTRVLAVGGNRVDSWEDLTIAFGTASAGRTTLRLGGGDSVVVELPSGREARSELVGALVPHRVIEPVLGEVASGGPADSAPLEVAMRDYQARLDMLATKTARARFAVDSTGAGRKVTGARIWSK
jgi:regulator of sigma E protease